jgi:hypothetical protein
MKYILILPWETVILQTNCGYTLIPTDFPEAETVIYTLDLKSVDLIALLENRTLKVQETSGEEIEIRILDTQTALKLATKTLQGMPDHVTPT